MLRVTLLGIWARRARLVRLITAVGLGVAFLVGTFVLGDTLRHSYQSGFSSASSGVGVVVKSQTTFSAGFGLPPRTMLLDGGLADRIGGVDGVADVASAIEGYAAIQGSDGNVLGGRGSAPVGGAWIADPALSAYRLTSGRAPQADNEIVVNQRAAADGHLRVGDHVVVDVPQPVRVDVVGIAAFGRGGDLGDSTYAAFTTHAARRYFAGGRDLASAFLVRAADGVSDGGLARRIQKVLPAGMHAVTGSQDASDRAGEASASLVSSLQTFLFVFAAIALVVAVSSARSTFSIVFAQRTRELGLLRAIGATRRQLLGTALGESLIVGLVASVAGLAAGIGLGAGLKAMFSGFGFPLPAGSVVIEPRTLVVGPLVGVVLTLVAGAAPALRVSRVPAVAALREGTVGRAARSRTALRTTTAVVVLVAGIAACLAGTRGTSSSAMRLAGLGSLLVLVGALEVAPLIAGPVAEALGKPVQAWRGVPGLMARRSASGDPHRTASTAAALTIGVSVVAFFAVFGASLGTSIDHSLSRSLRADVVLSPGSDGGALAPDLAGQVASVPGVAGSVGLGSGAMVIAGQAREVTVADPAALGRLVDLHVTQGTLGDGDLNVSAAQARANHWHVGSVLDGRFPDGSVMSLRIGAVYDDTTIAGAILVNRAVWAPRSPQELDTAVFVKAAAGATIAALTTAVTRATAGDGPVKVETNRAFGDDQKQAVKVFLGLVYAVLTLSVLIALLTIANAVSLAVYERTRELGLLRAVGQTAAQLRSMVRWEAAIVAAFGCLLGLAVGTYAGWAVVRAAISAGKSLGPVAVTAVSVPPAQLIVTLVVGVCAGILAVLRPARRAGRLDVITAIANE